VLEVREDTTSLVGREFSCSMMDELDRSNWPAPNLSPVWKSRRSCGSLRGGQSVRSNSKQRGDIVRAR